MKREKLFSSEEIERCLANGITNTANMTPVSDVRENKRGKWINKKTPLGKLFTVCSCCNTEFKFVTPDGGFARANMGGVNFCPNCGADMRE